MFDDKFVETLPEDPILAAKEMCDRFHMFHKKTDAQKRLDYYEDYLNALGVFKALVESSDLNFDIPPLSTEDMANINKISQFFSDAYRKLVMMNAMKYKPQFAIKFGKIFVYEFSDEDFARVQEIINELRELISKSKAFEEDFKTRLLKRVEKLQSELHKKMSNLDRFWGFIGDAGVALGKFGQDVKPLTDRIQEMVKIIWRTQALSEGVPGTPSLPFTENNQLED